MNVCTIDSIFHDADAHASKKGGANMRDAVIDDVSETTDRTRPMDKHLVAVTVLGLDHLQRVLLVARLASASSFC